MMGKWFAIAQIAQALVVSAAYFYQGDTRKGLYWFCAACITSTVTF